MRYEKRTKGTARWRRVSDEEVRSLIGDYAARELAPGGTFSTESACYRRCDEQPNLPGVGEGAPGAYGEPRGTLQATPEALQDSLRRIRSQPVVDENTRFVEDMSDSE